jgi:hypothetical protein
MKKKKSFKQLGDTLGESGVNYSQLNHDETLRATALSLACKYYVETIVKDGDLYREMVRDNKVLKPATYMGVVEVAFNFEAFLNGELRKDLDAITEDSKIIAAAREKMEQEAEKPLPRKEQELK